MEEVFAYWWPVFMIVAGDVLYQVCAKKMAKKGNPIAGTALSFEQSHLRCSF